MYETVRCHMISQFKHLICLINKLLIYRCCHIIKCWSLFWGLSLFNRWIVIRKTKKKRKKTINGHAMFENMYSFHQFDLDIDGFIFLEI